jgi:GDP-mannose transporter
MTWRALSISPYFVDYCFLGRALPNARSWASLIAIVIGAMAYVYTDSNFEVGTDG